MLNKWVGAGRVVNDPEIKTTTAGCKMARFTMAVERDWRQKNGEKNTDFIQVVAWRKPAEFIERYFNKGKMVMVEGRLQIRPVDSNDGRQRDITEITAEKVYFCGWELAGEDDITYTRENVLEQSYIAADDELPLPY